MFHEIVKCLNNLCLNCEVPTFVLHVILKNKDLLLKFKINL